MSSSPVAGFRPINSAFFAEQNRLPKVAGNGTVGEARDRGKSEFRLCYLPRLSPRKVAARPRHFLLYNSPVQRNATPEFMMVTSLACDSLG